jgi:two-component system cell cycle sensor histidine kinase/response regulator CckA
LLAKTRHYVYGFHKRISLKVRGILFANGGGQSMDSSGSHIYKDLFEGIPTAILLVRSERIVYSNPAASQLTGLEPDELSGIDPVELFEAEDRVRLRKIFRRRMEGARSRGGLVFRLQRPDGTIVRVEMESTPVKGDEFGTLLVFFRDVARRRRMEDRFRQIQKMEAVGQLAAGIAHDFNNLLGAMANYLTLLRAHVDPKEPEDGYLRQIQGLVDRGTALVRQVLSVSRTEGRELPVHDLNETLRPVIQMLHHSLPKRVAIQVEEGDGLLPFRMDSGQIQQVVMNLCINAADAMPAGGQIRLRTSRSRVTREMAESIPGVEPGHYARITVTDSGVGMDRDVRQRIFEPFFTTKKDGERSGLGLSMCYAIVRQHGGFIDVESETSRGTSFSVFLPLVEGELRIEAPARERPEVQEGQETLLLVDDEPTMVDSTALLLRGLGYTVFEATSGREALNLLAENTNEIQLALIDMGMPGMDGVETFREMRKVQRDLRALLLTGLPQSDEAQEALTEGFADIVEKPFRVHELCLKIRRALQEPASKPLQENQPYY